MSPDLLNGLFELGGAVFLLLNLRALWKHREIRGVHWAPTVFFQAWGLFNLWFYPSQALWWSFAGGAAIAAVNCAWLGSFWWLNRRF